MDGSHFKGELRRWRERFRHIPLLPLCLGGSDLRIAFSWEKCCSVCDEVLVSVLVSAWRAVADNTRRKREENNRKDEIVEREKQDTADIAFRALGWYFAFSIIEPHN